MDTIFVTSNEGMSERELLNVILNRNHTMHTFNVSIYWYS